MISFIAGMLLLGGESPVGVGTQVRNVRAARNVEESLSVELLVDHQLLNALEILFHSHTDGGGQQEWCPTPFMHCTGLGTFLSRLESSGHTVVSLRDWTE